MLRRFLVAACTLTLGGAPALDAPRLTTRQDSHPVLQVGERLTYDVQFIRRVGQATMEVLGVDTVRGRPAWHTRLSIDGGILFFKVHDRYESWIDTAQFQSLRFWQDLAEGRGHRSYHYEIDAARGVYRENDKPEQPTVAEPLDDASFIYWVRTQPLEVGQRYDVNRYFIPDRNPVTLDVLRRDSISTPAGRFGALVIRPIIKSKGIFAEGGRAELWFSDDEHRYLLRLSSHLAFGTIILTLRGIDAPGADTTGVTD